MVVSIGREGPNLCLVKAPCLHRPALHEDAGHRGPRAQALCHTSRVGTESPFLERTYLLLSVEKRRAPSAWRVPIRAEIPGSEYTLPGNEEAG